MRGATVVRRVGPSIAGILAAGAGAALWAIFGGAPTARALRRVFAALDPLLVLEVSTALVVIGVGLSLSGRRVSLPLGRLEAASARVPTTVALATIVALAAVFRVVLGAAHHLPIVFGDELIYSGLAKGWALHGRPLLHGHVELGYSTLYPLFLAPAYGLAGNGAEALAAAKALNAVAMASTAVPAYLLARRALPRGWALGVAALAVWVPWTAYAALSLTESLFYPVFVAYAAVLAWTLERPTWRRQAATLILLAAVVGVRTQGLAAGAGAVVAILLYAAGGGGTAYLRRFLPTFGALVAAVIALLGAKAAGIATPTSTYDVLFDSLSSFGGMLKWGAWSLASFALAVGVAAVAVFPVAARTMLRAAAPPPVRSVGATALALTLSLLGSVALLSASPYGQDRLHERSLFFVAPLLLVSLAYWLRNGLERPLALSAASAVATVALVAVVPERLFSVSFHVDLPSGLFFRQLHEQSSGVSFRFWAVAIAAVGVGTFLLARRPLFPLLTVVIAFAAITARVDYADALSDRQAEGMAWVDRTLPAGAEATLVELGLAYSVEPCASAAWNEQERLTVWTEYLNTRLGRSTYLYRPNVIVGVAADELTVGEGGLILDGDRPFDDQYVVIDSRQRITGIPLGRFEFSQIGRPFQEGSSLTLWRVDPPLRIYDRPEPLPPRGNGQGC